MKEYFVKFNKFESDKINFYSFNPHIHCDLKEISAYLNNSMLYSTWKLPTYVVKNNPKIKSFDKNGIVVEYNG